MGKERNLEIGGGTHPVAHQSWEQFDMHPWPELTAYPRFHIGDARNLGRFADWTFRQIVSHQTLEHFSWRETHAVLNEWYRVIEPQGLLTLELPDVMGIVTDYLADRVTWSETVERLYGSQDYEGNAHYAGFTIKEFPAQIGTILGETAKIMELKSFANGGGFRCIIRKDVIT